MFKDYYKILNVSPSVDAATIKQAYREMSLKWHPDKNPGVEVTAIMQDINEAYAILKDAIKRSRYDQEYVLFSGTFEKDDLRDREGINEDKDSQPNWTYEYNVQDDTLKKDIKDARQYAKELVEEFLNISKRAAKGAASNAFDYAVGWVIAGVFLAILGGLARACS